VTEDLAFGFCNGKERQVTIEIDNGDNVPLTVDKVEPQSLERRIYFDPAGKTAINLYYGDEKLPAPEYDYARFFHKEADAAQAVIAAETLNPSYTGRPDERPWSERHKWGFVGSNALGGGDACMTRLEGSYRPHACAEVTACGLPEDDGINHCSISAGGPLDRGCITVIFRGDAGGADDA